MPVIPHACMHGLFSLKRLGIVQFRHNFVNNLQIGWILKFIRPGCLSFAFGQKGTEVGDIVQTTCFNLLNRKVVMWNASSPNVNERAFLFFPTLFLEHVTPPVPCSACSSLHQYPYTGLG
jgi:hypothetical protein